MIQQNLSMSRDTRTLLQELEALAKSHNKTTLVTHHEVYIAEQLLIKYYIGPILNTIKSKIKNIRSKSSKHFTVEYWSTVIDTQFANNSSVKRENSPIIIIDTDKNTCESFMYIIQYMPTDYSIFDAMIIYNIVHTYDKKTICDSIRVSKDNNVYNIQYVKAVIERAQALSNIRMQEIKKLNDRAEKSDSILCDNKVNNTVLDIATATYNWEKAREDAEIIAQLRNAGILEE